VRRVGGRTNDDEVVPHELPIDLRLLAGDEGTLGAGIVRDRHVDLSLLRHAQSTTGPDDECVQRDSGFAFEFGPHGLKQSRGVDAGGGSDLDGPLLRTTAEQKPHDDGDRRHQRSEAVVSHAVKRAPYRITAAPGRQSAAPAMSVTRGAVLSTAASQKSELTMYTPP
jgi:hypothetical protein